MPFIALFSVLIFISVLFMTIVPLSEAPKKADIPKAKISGVESGRYRMKYDKEDLQKRFPMYWDISAEKSRLKKFTEFPKRDAVEAGLLRICRTLDFLSRSHGCSWADDPKKIWMFLTGGTDYVGSLSNLKNGTASDTFSCLDGDRYGKKLARNAFPEEYYDYKYDLRNLDENGTDPCGYMDFVSK